MTAVPFAVVQRAEAMMAVLEAEESLAHVMKLRMGFGTVEPHVAAQLTNTWNRQIGLGDVSPPPPRRVTSAELLAKRPSGLKLIRVPKRG